MKTDTDTIEINSAKTTASPEKYFALFDKYIPSAYSSDSTILLFGICNEGCIEMIARKNPDATYVVYDCQEMTDTLPLLIPNCKFVFINNKYDNVELDKQFEYNLSGMKFDCIIMNPPYGSRKNSSVTLHYDITDTALKTLKADGKCVSLMPITLIKSSHDGKKAIETKKLYDLYLKEIVEIDGNEVFDTSMKSIAIYDFENNKNETDTINIKTFKKSEIVKSLFDFDYNISLNESTLLAKLKFGNFANRRQKFQTYVSKKQLIGDKLSIFVDEFIDKHFKFFNGWKYFICFNAANGGMNAKWQNNTLSNIGVFQINDMKKILMLNNGSMKSIIGFKENELQSAQNILKLINCNCLRYPLLKTQDDQNMCPRVYKYFPDIDYTNIDTEEKFYKHFNITSEEQKIIEETMEKYV